MEFAFNLQPISIEVDAVGQANGVKVVRTELGAPDEKGRRSPQPVAGSEHTLAADAVIMAFGFQPHAMPWLSASGVILDNRGRISAPEIGDYPYQTGNDKIFAGGDAVRGSDLVVTAIAEGRKAAESIMSYLNV